jgi:hypothetical protein
MQLFHKLTFNPDANSKPLKNQERMIWCMSMMHRCKAQGDEIREVFVPVQGRSVPIQSERGCIPNQLQ